MSNNAAISNPFGLDCDAKEHNLTIWANLSE